MKSATCKTNGRLKSALNLFKGVVAGCGLLLMLPCARAQFTWPVYEPFGEYQIEPQRLGSPDESATNWNFGNSTATGVSSFVITNSAMMSYPALLADPNLVPKGVEAVPHNGSADRGATFTPQTGTVYASFLLNYQDNNGATIDRSIFQIVPNAVTNNSFTRVWTAVWLTPDYRLRLTKNFNAANLMSTADFSDPTPVVSTNVPHLVVMRYLRVPGGQDEVDLWVDPTPFGDDANIPPPMIVTSNAPNVASFNGFALSNRKLNGASSVPPNLFQIDEIRVGDTWSSVTPLATPAPGPIFQVTGGGAGCPGDLISIGLSGSVAGNDYLLFTNSVYAGVTLAGTGSALDFGPQTTQGFYSVLASNTVTGDIGWMANSPQIYVRAPAVIVNQPVSLTTTTNNRASFSVTCTGDELVYQWHKQGSGPLSDDSHITGSTTPQLIIWPDTAADIGSYYCVVTNPCASMAVSDTVTLNLGAPNDLLWTGDAFNVNIWDIGTSFEFNGGVAVFNPGDNVTFDDTFTYANAITLDGVLTPTTVTVNATRDYNWVGTGYIAGSAALVKEGFGTLTLDNNVDNGYLNPYTGGTVISGGTLNITNGWANLGTGPVTLAGGTLESWNKGNGSSSGLPNDLQVTADSTWQIDRTGDQCAGLLGSLIGNSGTTLNLYSSSVNQNSINRIRFGGVFTNGLAIAVSVNPLATNSALDVATYNNTGAQVFNGPISGEQTGFLVVGAGSTYLNGANTYTRDTTTYVGFLAGSGSINGQLVVNAGTTVGGGSQDAIGTFTVNSNIFLNGDVLIRVDTSLAQPNDKISATGTITNGGTGTVTITNIGATSLTAGQTLQIFSKAVSNGEVLHVTGAGMVWQNNLAVDGSVQAISAISTNPPTISYSISGGTLTLTWPAANQGWILQSQTSPLGVGLANNWQDIPVSANGTNYSVNLDTSAPAVFYRLRNP